MKPDEVLKLVEQLKASDPELTPAEIVQGVRTLVHERLQDAQPVLYRLEAPEPGKTRQDYAAAEEKALKIKDATARLAELSRLHNEERDHRAERVAKAKASVPAHIHVAFEKARPAGVRDAHHYAQYLHGIDLWDQTNAIVAEAREGGAF